MKDIFKFPRTLQHFTYSVLIVLTILPSNTNAALAMNPDSESEFLATYDITKYERPSVTADVVAFSVQDRPTGNCRKPFESRICVLLVKRGNHPFKGNWALPGGFLEKGETIEHCAKRELAEETALANQALLPISVFSKPGRDPRGWIISCAFLTIVRKDESHVEGGDDAAEAKWTPVDDVLSHKIPLAFDHFEILTKAIERLRLNDKIDLAFKFLPEEFTIPELQFVHEFIEGKKLLAPNFRREILPYLSSDSTPTKINPRNLEQPSSDKSLQPPLSNHDVECHPTTKFRQLKPNK